ncbi:MAG: hypothetical protein J6Q30_02290 [Oscillospiraceae bacterium]|nr:hypothetical protein [Oscillospiraceae bacterium]
MMQMNKQMKSFVAMFGIVAVVYVLLFALIPFTKPAGSWLMFIFSLISIAGGCGITLYAFGKGDSLMSKFYGYPVFKIGIGYMLLQLGLSVLVHIIGAFTNVPYWVGLLLSLVMAGTAGIGIIAADNAHDFIEQMDNHEDVVTRNITYFNIDISDLLEMCRDETLHVSLKELATKCKYSDPVSIPETEEKEQQIKMELQELHALIEQNENEKANEKIQLVLRMLSSRNRICQANK